MPVSTRPHSKVSPISYATSKDDYVRSISPCCFPGSRPLICLPIWKFQLHRFSARWLPDASADGIAACGKLLLGDCGVTDKLQKRKSACSPTRSRAPSVISAAVALSPMRRRTKVPHEQANRNLGVGTCCQPCPSRSFVFFVGKTIRSWVPAAWSRAAFKRCL